MLSESRFWVQKRLQSRLCDSDRFHLSHDSEVDFRLQNHIRIGSENRLRIMNFESLYYLVLFQTCINRVKCCRQSWNQHPSLWEFCKTISYYHSICIHQLFFSGTCLVSLSGHHLVQSICHIVTQFGDFNEQQTLNLSVSSLVILKL